MEEKKSIKFGVLTVLLLLAIIIIAVMAYFLYQLNNEKTKETEKVSTLNNQVTNLENNVESLQETINNVSNIISGTKQETIDDVSNTISDTKNENVKIEIPKASTNISNKEENIISNYFQGVWTTDNGENLLAIDYGKRFCNINLSNNSKEYGTYTVKDEAGAEPTITLNYTSGKTLELKLVQGEVSFLASNDGKTQYEELDTYYFGAGEGDEGIFNN